MQRKDTVRQQFATIRAGSTPYYMLIKLAAIPGGIVLFLLLDIWTHDFGTSLSGPEAGLSLLAFYLIYMALLLRPRLSFWPRWRFISVYLLTAFAFTLVTGMFASPVLRLIGYAAVGSMIFQARTIFGRNGLWLVCGVLLFTICLNTFFLWGERDTLALPVSSLPVGLWLIGLAFLQTFTALGVHERTARIRNEQLIRLLLATQQQLRVYAARAEELAATRERMHAAREMHDTQAQGFAAIKMHLETCKLVFDEQPGQASQHLEQARLLAGEYLSRTRLSIAALRSDLPQESSIQQALAHLATTWQECGLTVHIHMSSQLQTHPIPMSLAQTYARIAEEALNNAYTHGHASHIEIELSLEAEELCLTITDDGIGFEPEPPERYTQSGHFGIVGMYERIHAVQGQIDLISSPGMGTQVVVMTPLQNYQNGVPAS